MFSHLGVTSRVGGLDRSDEPAVEGLEATALAWSAHTPLWSTVDAGTTLGENYYSVEDIGVQNVGVRTEAVATSEQVWG